MAATPMTGGEALVRSLYNEGVRVVFGLPGVQLYGVMAALRDEPRIRFITTRHEQATSFMADGYARAGGDFGTALVVPGPGLLNAMSGLSTAYSASSPVLMLSGQIPRDASAGTSASCTRSTISRTASRRSPSGAGGSWR
jgi:acetolactate synthase-1/2/3 large subunit